MPDLVVLDERSAGVQPSVIRYVNLTTPTTMSAVFGTAVATAGAVSTKTRNRVFVYDATTLYTVVQDGLYKSTDSGATFAIDKAFTTPAVATDDLRLARTGIYQVFDNGSGDVFLVGMFVNAAGNQVGWRLNLNSDLYEETVGVADANGYKAEILFNNVLHVITGGAAISSRRSWDPIAQTHTAYADPAGFGFSNSTSFAVGSDGSLYALTIDSGGSSTIRLFKFTGVWTDQGFSVGSSATNPFTTRGSNEIGLFTDGTDLYAVVLSESTGTGWRVHRLQAPFTSIFASVHTTVFAAQPSLLNGADGGTAAFAAGRVELVQDTVTTLGVLITYFGFIIDDAPGSAVQWYQWAGPASPVVLLGPGGSNSNAKPTPTGGSGGARFYVPGQLHLRWGFPARAPALTGQTLRFIGSGGGTHRVRFRRDKLGQPTDGPLAKLIGPVTGGGALGTDEVTAHPFDGVTPGTVVWDLTNDVPPFVSGESNIGLVLESGV